ncbi:hypothetical protein DES40_0323 [Litorimonas taeanensis]|uniref:Uncharacterized protein n=1 Tax=Litorimonas taeanensis TaxID=568099 RepID=A0A420WJC3_9PROT|nr:hypothetical protein [Litorimonas taeanensis]RKQ71015.1 hypothetical protein DES40_0323 [Litorimonas taeanensis]
MKESEIFTLWADDSQPEAIDPKQRKSFKAHLILNAILNDRIVMSDSQVITCRNFRHLVRDDACVSELIKSGVFSVAMRTKEKGNGPISDLMSLDTEFHKTGKIRPDNTMGDRRVEDLEFLEKHAPKKIWSISEIGNNYANNAKRIIYEHFCSMLDDRDRLTAREIIRERESVRNLDRFFLQEEFLSLLQPRLQSKYDMRILKKGLHDSYIAPYISNLPSILNLNPIYLPNHKKSFQIFRGSSYEMVDMEDPIIIEPELDHSHFVEGLCRLDIDDIFSLKSSKFIKNYVALSGKGINSAHDHESLQHAFFEANIAIERKIIERFQGLKTSTTVPNIQHVKRQYARDKKAIGVALDILGLALFMPFAGTITSALFDVYEKRKFGTADEQNMKVIGSHRSELNKIERYLKQSNQSSALNTELIIHDTNSFKQETISHVIDKF